MLGRMRTTLALDADVADMLRRMQQAHGRSFKAVVNDALRQGLRQMASPSEPPAHYRTPVAALGRCLADSLDDVPECLRRPKGSSFGDPHDANLLVYAHVGSFPQHGAAREWPDEKINGTALFGLPWPSLLGFARLVTDPHRPRKVVAPSGQPALTAP